MALRGICVLIVSQESLQRFAHLIGLRRRKGETPAIGDKQWVLSYVQVFIWRVPEGFTLYSDAEEPADVTPIAKLAGHTRYSKPDTFVSDSADTT
jgi:hypothetical protein